MNGRGNGLAAHIDAGDDVEYILSLWDAEAFLFRAHKDEST